MTPEPSPALRMFAARYTAAWCSQNPASVAAFFSSGGSLTINSGSPAIGRAAISEAAQGFMTAFPDLVVSLDDLVVSGDTMIYKWTLDGANTGPGGTGNHVRVSGFGKWHLASDALIEESLGYYDAEEYRRQVEGHADHAARHRAGNHAPPSPSSSLPPSGG